MFICEINYSHYSYLFPMYSFPMYSFPTHSCEGSIHAAYRVVLLPNMS